MKVGLRRVTQRKTKARLRVTGRKGQEENSRTVAVTHGEEAGQEGGSDTKRDSAA